MVIALQSVNRLSLKLFRADPTRCRARSSKPMLAPLKKLQDTLRVRSLSVVHSGAPDPDIEQAWLRVTICAIGFLYVCFLASNEGLTPGLAMGLAASSGDALVGAFAIWWLRRSRRHVVPLRYTAIAADNMALTLGMAGAGEAGVAMIGVYLWVTIGNGFRFGPRFLLVSYWLALSGFSLQLIFVPFWAQHLMIGIGMLISGAIVPLYALVLIVRLTAQKDAAEELSNAKSRFVANVSHELRTPLTGLFAVYDLLRTRNMPPDDRELVGMLGSAVKTLKVSVDAVLQMSKLEAGAEHAENRLFNLWFFVHQLSAIVRPQSVAKDVRWSVNIDPAVPTAVWGDPIHLSHVLGNLINNAFKFTPAGSVSLRATLTGGSNIRFEVMDTGIGIPLDQQERLFERFVQVDSSATRKFGGTGLGTSIARDLTELMGGKIGVVSAPGNGSTFSVELPLARADQAPHAVDWTGRHRVLVIGHAGSPRDAIARRIRTLGLAPLIHDVVDAQDRLSGESPLATILAMPAKEASAMWELVRGKHPVLIGCPWIVATACTPAERMFLMASGTADVLPAIPDEGALRVALAALVHRLEIPSDSDARSLPDSGITRSLDILLADDNRSNQLLLARILQDAGHRVALASNGGEAFDAMTREEPGLAILDLNMPDISGPDVIKLYRAASLGANKLPIIILSADATPAAKQQSLEAGADEFLTKPVSAATLLAAIGRVIAGNMTRLPTDAPAGRHAEPTAAVLVDPDRISALRRIARGDSQFLEKYIGAAFTEIEKAISDLRVSASRGDTRCARDAIHIIEGTGGSIGGIALVANCKSIRSYLQVPHDPDCAAALAELSTTHALTKSAVQASLHDAPLGAARSQSRS